ncbi:Carbon monoxide dehydrogenase subunit G [Faunimonas pinastri]|uniref:Carbon monoxide dehydrogenase subunit G n=1 Tax=Faunimonas pinastri TaxID=1855383 RepID=A0A1H9HL42_9HYPH|nr:Carbon monoxide dehydrogenase subunit G [Faunimonas pinastri]
MELRGEYRIPLPREDVWALLNDPEVLRDCLPGCESLERTGDGGFAAKVTTKIGPVKATFNGTVTLSGLNPPTSYTISGEGKGGVAGFASGNADVNLAEEDGGTVLTYVANAQVGGKLAQLGSRLIDATAKKLADQFFSCLAARAGVSIDVTGADDAFTAEATPGAEGVSGEPVGGVGTSGAFGTAPAGTLTPGSIPVELLPGATIPPAGTGVPIIPEAVPANIPAEIPDVTLEDRQSARSVARDAPPATVAGFAGRSIPDGEFRGDALDAAEEPLPEDLEPSASGERVDEAANEIENEIEGKAAIGFLGGPYVWGLIVLVVLGVIWFVMF